VLTRSGWALLATTGVLVVAAAWGHESQLWALAAAAAVALLVATAWRLTGPRLALDRRLPRDRVTVGEDVEAELAVTNLGRRPTGPLRGREGFGSTTFTVELPSVAAGARVELAYQLPTDRRGVVPLGPFVIERTDPLALASRVQTHTGSETLWIHPRVHPVAPLAAGLRPTPEGRAQHVSPQATLAFHSLREYVVGDDLRQVHWRSTAHTGTLMVRHNLDAAVPSGVVLLDNRRWVHQPDSFEEAVEVAASLVAASTRAHLPIRLLTTSGLQLDDHRADQMQFLDQLAAVDLDDHGRLVDVGRLLPRRRHGVALAVVTGMTRDEDRAALAQLGQGFTPASVIRVSPGPGSPVGAALPGLEVIDVETAADFVLRWGQLRR
jgi:uncharacterized protein (DUF58 family)